MPDTITDNYGTEHMQDPWPSIKRLDKITSYHDREIAVLQRDSLQQQESLRVLLNATNKIQGGVTVIQWLFGTSIVLTGLYVSAKAGGVI